MTGARAPRRARILGVAFGTLLASVICPGAARGDGQGIFGASCVQGYAKAFAEVGNAASELRLKLDNASAEVGQSFKERPPRCEAGAYDYYLDQLMGFVRRALRSGATPTSPKDGWVRAAALMMDYSPRLVPRAEYYADMQRFQATRKELLLLITDAGAGPLPSALASAFERAAPSPGAYGPPAAPPTEPQAPAYQAQPPTYQAQPPAYQAQPPTYQPQPAAGQQIYIPAQPVYQPQPYQPQPQPQSASTIPANISFPREPMPDWAVISLHEIRDLLKSGRGEAARGKLDQVIRWIEQR